MEQLILFSQFRSWPHRKSCSVSWSERVKKVGHCLKSYLVQIKNNRMRALIVSTLYTFSIPRNDPVYQVSLDILKFKVTFMLLDCSCIREIDDEQTDIKRCSKHSKRKKRCN